MCYLGMCALWSLDVGKGGGVLRFCVFLGMWYLGMCALWSLDVGKQGGSAGVVEAPVASTSTSRPPESDGVRRRESWLVSFFL